METKNTSMFKRVTLFLLTAIMVCTFSFSVFALESETGAEAKSTATSNGEATVCMTVFLSKPNTTPNTQAELDSFSSDANANCQTKDELFDCIIEHGLYVQITTTSAFLEDEFTQSLIADYEEAGLPYTIEIDENLAKKMQEMDANAKQFLEENDLPPAPPATPYPELSKLHDSIMQERLAERNK